MEQKEDVINAKSSIQSVGCYQRERKKDCSTFLWISRHLNPQLAYKHDGARPTPASHKEAVLKGPKIQELLDKISRNQNVPKADLEEQVKRFWMKSGTIEVLKSSDGLD
ncbi:hypothetical protein NQ318_005299 [Aromia moschata]|uniref:Uncharacterized protein n=1 Tax=Aromia moschata TaxID=1265417 RepID=A0AAV8XVM0_9CUCU|nr:hypothetical protein NQ318_005299 [Aromia moschata]